MTHDSNVRARVPGVPGGIGRYEVAPYDELSEDDVIALQVENARLREAILNAERAILGDLANPNADDLRLHANLAPLWATVHNGGPTNG